MFTLMLFSKHIYSSNIITICIHKLEMSKETNQISRIKFDNLSS